MQNEEIKLTALDQKGFTLKYTKNVKDIME